MGQKLNLLKRVLLSILLSWTAIIVIFLANTIVKNFQYADELGLQEALVSVKKDLAYRTWAASHGGVYVPVTERTPPNPYLSHIPTRDVTTQDGQNLTLMNPAYILSQMMRDYSQLYGVKARITSDKVLNPQNAPDDWELKGLNIIASSKEPYYEKSDINGEEYLRYLNPLFVVADCLKCHGHQGYRIGDLRGAVSVSIPLLVLQEKAVSQSIQVGVYFLIIWLLGLLGIFGGYKRIERYLLEQLSHYEQHIYTLVDVIEKRDNYTAGHTHRVAEYADKIAGQMAINTQSRELLHRACMLHDIGKISTPDSILLKPGKLTPLEYKLIQGHVTTSYDLLRKVDIFENIAEIVRHHHERFDGKGYPQGLTGEQIPFLSQIMTVADAFDAMTTNRIYKPRKTLETALKELQGLKGKQFHPDVVAAALIALKNVRINLSENQLPKTELEKERFSYFYKDVITGAYNRDYLEFVLSHRVNLETKDFEHDQAFYQYNGICAIFLHHFSQFNKSHGWQNGDILLRDIVAILKNISESALIFRVFGDDFIVLDTHEYQFKENVSMLSQRLAETGIDSSYQYIDIEHNPITSIKDLEKLL